MRRPSTRTEPRGWLPSRRRLERVAETTSESSRAWKRNLPWQWGAKTIQRARPKARERGNSKETRQANPPRHRRHVACNATSEACIGHARGWQSMSATSRAQSGCDCQATRAVRGHTMPARGDPISDRPVTTERREREPPGVKTMGLLFSPHP